MPAILFICTANLYRSPLAAAFLRKKLEELSLAKDWQVDSAGTWTTSGTAIHSQTIEDAINFGLDVLGHKSQQVTAKLLASNDLILVMETGQKEALTIEFPDYSSKIFLLAEVIDGIAYNIPDPLSFEGEHDRDIVNELAKLIDRGTDKILAMAKSLKK